MQQKAKCNYKYPAPQRQAGLRNIEPASARAQYRWSQVSSFPMAALAAWHPLQHSLLKGLSPSWATSKCHLTLSPKQQPPKQRVSPSRNEFFTAAGAAAQGIYALELYNMGWGAAKAIERQRSKTK